MEHPAITRYFLGANSRFGFHSLYSCFCPAEGGGFLHVIKGGPGCGKSSFMKRIGSAAEKRGLDVEYILCSGDPDSLDGIFIPALNIGYVDGTAPHAMDVAYPGCRGMYLDLGRFYDTKALSPRGEEIMDINRRYKSLYSAAYSYIAAVAAALPRCYPGLWGSREEAKLQKRAEGFSGREFKDLGKGKARMRERFIGSLGCKGEVFLSSTVESLCSRICLLDNELGLGNLYLEKLLPLAMEKDTELILCRDYLDPRLISAILMPELSLALVCGGGSFLESESCRHIRLDTLPDRERIAALRPALRQAKRLSRDYMGLAHSSLASAKALHDELEAIYNPHVDFDGVYEEAENHIKWLF